MVLPCASSDVTGFPVNRDLDPARLRKVFGSSDGGGGGRGRGGRPAPGADGEFVHVGVTGSAAGVVLSRECVQDMPDLRRRSTLALPYWATITVPSRVS